MYEKDRRADAQYCEVCGANTRGVRCPKHKAIEYEPWAYNPTENLLWFQKPDPVTKAQRTK